MGNGLVVIPLNLSEENKLFKDGCPEVKAIYLRHFKPQLKHH